MENKNQIQLNEDQRDCLQEISNIAMGQAGDNLARLLKEFVILSIPHVDILSSNDIAMALQSLQDSSTVSGVCQGFLGGGLAGEAMLIFNDASFTDLAKLLKYEGEIDDHAQQELLMDTASVLSGACLKGIAEQLDIEFSFGAPMLLGQHVCIADLLNNTNRLWKQALVIEINYKVENHHVDCDLLLILTEDSVKRLFTKIDCLLA
ncbi:MAG: histidine kinase [Cellvibrionaceae bacterium]